MKWHRDAYHGLSFPIMRLIIRELCGTDKLQRLTVGLEDPMGSVFHTGTSTTDIGPDVRLSVGCPCSIGFIYSVL